jgi:hypothetical protein
MMSSRVEDNMARGNADTQGRTYGQVKRRAKDQGKFPLD